MPKMKFLEEAEISAKFFANIRLALDKEELARKKPQNIIMDWPRNLNKIQGKDLEPYKKKGMEVERELPSFQYFSITRQEYKKLKKEGNVLDYTRFKNLRNYFCIKRLQELPDKYKEKLKISLAKRETIIDEINLNTNNEDFVWKIRDNEDCENMLCSDSDIYILFFLFRHFNVLSNDTKIKLIEILLKKTADKEEFQILENSVIKKAIGKIKISSHDRRVFLSVLREVHDMRILPLLKDTFKENGEKDRLPYFLDIKEVAQEIWRKHSKLFIEEDINAVFNWLISLSNLDSKSKPSLYGIPRHLLFKLLESIDSKNEKHTKLYNQIFFTLHDKPFYSYIDFWSYLFDDI